MVVFSVTVGFDICRTIDECVPFELCLMLYLRGTQTFPGVFFGVNIKHFRDTLQADYEKFTYSFYA